jgi:uncharacterized protein (DUF433 family)
MSDQELLSRITVNPEVMVGKPVIKGTRLTVEYILNLLAHGASAGEILEEYKGLTADDIRACLLFASRSRENADMETVSLSTNAQFMALIERSRAHQAEKDGASAEEMRQRLGH